jgi:SAM-dependent methyltransferase
VIAAQRWAAELDAWAIPEEIEKAAPEPPWGFPVGLWRERATETAVDNPSRRRALEVLPKGGTVLDVGAGTGAGAFALVPPAGLVVGFDQSARMLEAFGERAEDMDIAHREIKGTWPDDAGLAPEADVVVCHHVFYNTRRLDEFARALGEHARRRVVVELTALHPMTAFNHIWIHLHGLDRPEGPSSADALAVLREAGIDALLEAWLRNPRPIRNRAEYVAFVRRRMCVGAERDPEIAELLGDERSAGGREVATIWWDV